MMIATFDWVIHSPDNNQVKSATTVATTRHYDTHDTNSCALLWLCNVLHAVNQSNVNSVVGEWIGEGEGIELVLTDLLPFRPTS